MVYQHKQALNLKAARADCSDSKCRFLFRQAKTELSAGLNSQLVRMPCLLLIA